jgi:hypothetical protein
MVYLETFLLVSHVDRIKMAIIIKKDVELEVVTIIIIIFFDFIISK